MNSQLDPSTLTWEDLLDEYKLLQGRYKELREKSDEDAQRIHELKRNLETASAAEAYLAQELEQLSDQSNINHIYNETKTLHEVEELRRKHKSLQNDYDALQHDYDIKMDETRATQNKLEELLRKNEQINNAQNEKQHEDCMERYVALETEHLELLQKFQEFRDSNVQQTLVMADKDTTIAILRDQVSCLQENLRSKRDELEEKMQMLEGVQEQLAEANLKIAALSTAPETGRKGNSLFAEVDDQRQAMKQLLAAQKKSYMEMKKCYTESEYEIRRLKRENIAMHAELQTCSVIFCNADRTYQDKLNERIRLMVIQNECLENKLNWTQERLKDLAGEKAVLWLDSMLNFCKQETDDLKKQLHSVRIQKASLEEQLRNSQQNLARWRFESLKSRCVIIDRENLLTTHNISFKPNNALEFDINQAQLEAARPRIVNVQKEEHYSMSTTVTVPIHPTAESSTATTKVANMPQQTGNLTENRVKIESVLITNDDNLAQDLQTSAKFETEPDIKLQLPITSIPIKSEAIKLVDEPESSGEDKAVDIKPTVVEAEVADMKSQLSTTPMRPASEQTDKLPKTLAITSAAETLIKLEDEPESPAEAEAIDMKPQLPITPMRPASKQADKLPQPLTVQSEALSTNTAKQSILSQKRDLFAEESRKTVQFSAAAPLVHRFKSPLTTDDDETNKENKPITIKLVHSKSNVIVKHIELRKIEHEKI